MCREVGQLEAVGAKCAVLARCRVDKARRRLPHLSRRPAQALDADVGHTRHEADACRIATVYALAEDVDDLEVGRERHALRRQGAPGLLCVALVGQCATS